MIYHPSNSLFGMEYTASQYQQLVANAEGLFYKLVENGISEDSRSQIEQWLYLKHECEDSFNNESSFPFGEKAIRSLERIDEVTESESKMSSFKSTSQTETDNESSDDFDELEKDETGDECSASKQSLKNKLAEKITLKLQKFKNDTEIMVNSSLGYSTSLESRIEHAISGNLNLFNRRRRSFLASEVLPNKNNSAFIQIHESREFRPIHIPKNDVTSTSMPEKSIKKQDRHSGTSSTENRNAISMLGREREELFRHEIINLRDTKDLLLKQRCTLDSKLNKDKMFTSDEERKFLEVDEAIEAIDAAIEHKNELLCGHVGVEYSNIAKEKSEVMLVDRLMKLSEPEMRLLLYKYFKKAVDLRESGRKMEQLVAEQEYQIETQTWKIQALCNALQQTHIENQRRLVMVQEKLQLRCRQNSSCANSTSTSSMSRFGDANTENSEPPLLELPGSFEHGKHPPNAISNLKKLQGSSTHTTKVTRKKNKLIIQQQKSKKNTKY